MFQNLINTLVLASIYLLFALGLSVVWGTVGILNFAHGVFFMFAAFTGSVVLESLRLPMIALLAICAVTGALLSVAIQIFAFYPIFRRSKDPRSAELQILIGAVGVSAIPLAIAEKKTSDIPFSFNRSSFVPQTYHLGGIRISNIQIIIIVCAAILTIAIAAWLRRSRTGLALRAIGVDPETASIHGMNRRTLALLAMAVSGAVAGLGGSLLTYYLGSLGTESGDNLFLKAFAVVVLGGVGSVLGVALGSFILALAETLVLTETSGTWVDAVSFGIIFVVLLVRPQGIFGRAQVRRT